MLKIFLKILLSISAYSYELKPFCTDGCSVVGNSTFTSFLCCVNHDLSYWAGGSEVEKYRADGRFYACLLKTEDPEIAEAYSAAVSLFGDDYWGLDWISRPRFQPLSEEEKKIIQKMTPDYPQKTPCIDNEIRASSVPIFYYK